MYEVAGSFKVTGTLDRLSEHLDMVMDRLVDAPGVLDAAIEGNMVAGEVRISVTIKAADMDEAGNQGAAIIRSAVKTAGGSIEITHPQTLRSVFVEQRRETELVEA